MDLDNVLNDQVPLEELVPEQKTVTPERMAKDRSAKLSIVSSPVRDPVITYQTLMAENFQGQNYLADSINTEIRSRNKGYDLQAVNKILSDSTIPFPQKERVLKHFNTLNLNPVNVENEILVKEASKNDASNDPEKESKIVTVMDRIQDVHDAAEAKQRIINSFASDLDSSTGKAMLDLIEMTFVPFATNKNLAQALEKAKKMGAEGASGSFLGNLLAEGETMHDLKTAFDRMPPQKQVEFLQQFAYAMKDSSGVFGTNDFIKFNQLMTLASPEEYGTFSRIVDNIAPYLDVVGLGWALRGLKKPPKALNTPKLPTPSPSPVNAPRGSTTAPRAPNIFEEARVSTPPSDTTGISAKLDDLYAQRAGLLGDSSGLAERGNVRGIEQELANLEKPAPLSKDRVKEIQSTGVSYKEAQKAATKEHNDLMADYNATKQRLEGMLEANRSAAKNEQALADLDTRIATLEKEIQANPVFQQNEIARSIQQIQWNSVRGNNNPMSAGRLTGAVNETSGRNLHAAVLNSPDDEFASALFGASRVDTLATDILPQVSHRGGSVEAGVSNIDAALKANIDPEVVKTSRMTESHGITPRERDMMFAASVNDFERASGLSLQSNMSSFSKDPLSGNFVYSATYGSSEGAFGDAVTAVNQTKFALSRYGVTEKDITLLQRKGNDLVPVDKSRIPDGPGEYFVRVEGESPFDLTGFSPEALDVKRNYFDRVFGLNWGKFGSLNRYLFDIDSTLHPVLTGSALAGDARAALLDKLLLNMADEAAQLYRKLPVESRNRVNEYMIRANVQRLPTTSVNMTAEGLNSAEQATVMKWRKFWDNHFHLENYDLVRSLNKQGYQILDNGQDVFYAKKMSTINTVPTSVNRVYDPTVGNIVDVTRQDIDTLYKSNGYMAKLRRPSVINGELVEYIKVRNTPTEYLRTMTQNDRVLNYTEGYYQITYKAPRFVDEISIGADGNKIRRAIAVAGDSLEAENFAKRMRQANGSNEYIVRGDERALMRDSDEFWDLNNVSGRIAQRHRGKTLEDASGMNHLGAHNYIIDPAEASIKAAHSIAGRTMMRPILDNMKERFIKQYGSLLQEENGLVKFPTNVGQIRQKGDFSSKQIADARTVFEAIRYWENGYINSLDFGTKAAFNAIGEMLSGSAKAGNKLAAKGERVANILAESGGGTGWAKSSTFVAYLGTHPLRQWIVQPNQILRLFSYSGPQAAVDIVKSAQEMIHTKLLGGKSTDPDLYNFIEKSGMLDSIDRSNLVRGALIDAKDRSNPALRTAAKLLNLPRKIGFDSAEQFNRIAHLTAAYRKYRNAGADMKNPDVLLQVQKEADAIGYSMNRSNDMVYNQGSASFLLQFLQVPHKAWLQLSNRAIPANVRRRMVATDMLIWGPPTAAVTAIFNSGIMPEDDPSLTKEELERNRIVREVVSDGLQSATINWYLRRTLGDEKAGYDLSSLDPLAMEGWFKLIDTIFEDGFSVALANSPAGGLWIRDGGKMQNVLNTITRFYAPIDPAETTSDKIVALAKDVARISSGFDSAYKAKMILDMETVFDQRGDVVKDKANTMDAIAQLFGFTNYDRGNMIKLQMSANKDLKKKEEQAVSQYKEMKRYFTDSLKAGETDADWQVRVIGWIMHTYRDDPVMEARIFSEYRKDIQNRDDTFIRTIYKMAGHKDMGDIKAYIHQSSLPKEEKKKMTDNLDFINNYRESKE